jgi:hypothetical protein
MIFFAIPSAALPRASAISMRLLSMLPLPDAGADAIIAAGFFIFHDGILHVSPPPLSFSPPSRFIFAFTPFFALFIIFAAPS